MFPAAVLVTLFLLPGTLSAQAVMVRSTVGAGGGSSVSDARSGTNYMQVAVGQASVAGSYPADGRYYNQGFVQPLHAARVSVSNVLEARVFPNPFLDRFDIVLTDPSTEPVRVRLFSVTGQLILDRDHAPAQRITVTTGLLASGAYIIRVDSDDRHYIGHLQRIH